MLFAKKTLAVLCISVMIGGCAAVKPVALTETDGINIEAPKSLSELLELGDASARSGDFDNARLNYALAVKSNPDNTEALYKLAFVHNSTDSHKVAKSLLRHLLSLDPTNEAASFLLASTLLKTEELSDAAEVYHRILGQNNNAHEAWNGLGVIFDLRAEHDSAQEFFSNALLINPTSPKYLNNLGYSLYLSGLFSDAEYKFNEALRYDNKYERAWSNLALLYSRVERYQDADAAFRKIVKEHQAANNIGYLSVIDGNDAIAREQLTRAIEVAPAYYDLANRNIRLIDNN